MQLLSVDGAMVPLVGGAWSEVKTLAVGTVQPDPVAPNQVRTAALSYFSRLSEAETFSRLATLETQRRGTETAQTVVAVVDGAAWCQGFIDHQRPDAIRILDFPHALEHLGTVAQARFGAGTEAAGRWLEQQAHGLRHGQEAAVLDRLAALAADAALPAEVREVSRAVHAYLHQRREQIQYQAFAAAGYPIGSGCVESANKLLVEARLKGSGMHWARANVNPMLALRGLVSNGRWAEAWPAIWDQLRSPTRDRHRARRAPVDQRIPASNPAPPPPIQPNPPAPPRVKTVVNGKPTAQHPWRRCSPFPAKS